MQNDIKQISFRLSEEVHEELTELANKSSVSLNSLILTLIHLGKKIYNGQAIISLSDDSSGHTTQRP